MIDRNDISPDKEVKTIQIPLMCHFCAETIDVNKFISVNGPEESYAFAKELMDLVLVDLKDSWSGN